MEEHQEPWYQGENSRRALTLAEHVVGNVGIIVARAKYGWAGFAAAATLITGAQIFASYKQVARSEQELADFYADKLGALLHKDAKSITIDDLRKAARPKEQGGLDIRTLTNEVKKFEEFRRVKTIGRLASVVLLTGVIIGMIALFPAFASGSAGVYGILGLAGSTMALATRAIDSYTDQLLKRRDENTVTHKIYEIDKEVKKNGTNPLRVMDVLVQARPALRQEILTRYGDYEELTANQKMQIVRDSESTLHVAALSDAINNGFIKANYLGFAAYGENVAEFPDTKRFTAYLASPASRKALPTVEMKQSHYVEKLAAEREMSDTHTLH